MDAVGAWSERGGELSLSFCENLIGGVDFPVRFKWLSLSGPVWTHFENRRCPVVITNGN